MKALSRNTWIAASLLALAALLLVCVPAFAEGEPPPEAPAAPLAPPVGSGVEPVGDPSGGDPQGDTPAPLALTDLPLYTGGDPWWKVGSQLYATVINLADCPVGTVPGVSCWASPSPIQEALNRINGGLIPSDRYLHIEPYPVAPFYYPDTDDIIID